MLPALLTLKPYILLLYGLFGVACLWLAANPRRPITATVGGETRSLSIGLIFTMVAAGVLLFVYVAVDSHLLLGASAIAIVVVLARPGTWKTLDALFASLSASLIALSLAWWRFEPSSATFLPLAAFAFVFVVTCLGLGDPGRFRAHLVWLATGVFFAAGLAIVADLGAYQAGLPMIATLTHHWGAFLGPALHLKAGLVPFYDVPAQYGLGPTLAIAAACNGTDCWTGAHVLFGGAHLIEALLILSMALATHTRRGWPWVCTATVIVFAAVFLWPGYPAEGNALMAMPSSGGIRFLPVTLLACFWFFGHPRAAIVAMVPALLWSPESAAMSLAVFGLCGTSHFGLRNAVVLAFTMLVGCYGALFLVHRAIYGVWIDPLALVEYVLHVPGPLPINPFSDILLLVATFGLGGWLVYNSSGDRSSDRRDLVVTALLFAATSYTLGRSHQNNICNIAPYLVLVALRVLDRPTATGKAIGQATAIGLCVSVAALALSPWNLVPFDSRIATDMHQVVAAFPEQEPDIVRLRSQVPANPQLGIADFGPFYARHPAEAIVWTPMDPSSLWAFVPSARRKVYIERSARRLRRSGWAIFADYELYILDDLKTAYNARTEYTYDGGPSGVLHAPTRYTVVCLDPKPEIASAHVGPACPPPEAGGLKAAQLP